MLDHLERLLAAATPAPWRTVIADGDDGVTRPHIRGGRPEPMGMWVAAFYAYADAGEGGDDNAALVAALRNAAPALLRGMKALETLCDAVDDAMTTNAEAVEAAVSSGRAAIAALEEGGRDDK